MLRKKVLAQFDLCYSAAYPHAEDYELWTRCIVHTTFANIEEVLLLYRVHHNQVSRQFAQLQKETTDQITKGYLRHIGIAPNTRELHIHRALAHKSFRMSRHFVAATEQWINRIRAANRPVGFFDEDALNGLFQPGESFIRVYRERTFWQNTVEAVGVLRVVLRDPLTHARRMVRKTKLKFIIKRLLGWKV